MPIRNLSTHPAHFLTVAELAEYWAVSRQQIYKRIESKALGAIRLGSRLYRVPTGEALDYERRASVASLPTSNGSTRAAPEAKAASMDLKLPTRIGLRRVRKAFG